MSLKTAKPEVQRICGDTLAARLRRRRRELGLLQREAADFMKVSMWSLIGWEKGGMPSSPCYPAVIAFLGYEPWPVPVTLGQSLIAERRRRGWSAKQAARIVCVDEGTWCRWERGEWRPTKRTLPVLNQFLGVDVKAVFPGEVR